MQIQCPHCGHTVAVNPSKPGRFGAKCLQCAGEYIVTLELKVEAQPQTRDETSAPTTEAATGVWTGGATEADGTIAQSGPVDADATTLGGSSGVSDGGTIPSTLGGYQIVKELGHGGMGSVYLAKQISLGRNVALKTMRPEWSRDAEFVARFTREAYAAAQLVHHNVVQIYDFGEDKGTNFFSMEFVDGSSLAALVAERKPIDPEVAVGYVLQAARGLKVAHDQCMIHRDIKPDNLLLNKQGIVKVANLGLVKTPNSPEPNSGIALAGGSAGTTLVGQTMGTPAYMAPEQAKDAASVDARADIYSLGCTLYVLVTGRPPFSGRTAIEVITKHANQAIPPPETISKRVPKGLSEIILRMVAKKPEDRFNNMSEVITALEHFLGVSSSGPFSPKELHVEALEQGVADYESAPTARLSKQTTLGLSVSLGLIIAGALVFRRPMLVGALTWLGFATCLSRFVIEGMRGRSILFTKVREWLLGAKPSEWATWCVGGVLSAVLLWSFGLVGLTISFGLAGMLLAAGLYLGFDRRAEHERAEPIHRIETLLKSLRIQGVDENAIQQFVRKYAGERWKLVYEELFGFASLNASRARMSPTGKPSVGRFDLRSPMLGWIEGQLRDRREKADLRLLQRIEERSLEAQGVNLVVARRKSRRVAEAMVATAAEARQTALTQRGGLRTQKSLYQSMNEAAEQPERVLVGRPDREGSAGLGWLIQAMLNMILGSRIRFLAGLALLAACAMWMDQNGLASSQQVLEIVKSARETQDVAVLEDLKKIKIDFDPSQPTRPLKLAMIPEPVLGLFNSYASGAAGLMLIASAFFRGWKMSLFAFPGAVFAIAGPHFGLPIPKIGTSDVNQFYITIGAVISGLGFFLGRTRL